MSEADVPSSFTIGFISEITKYVTKGAWRVEGRFDTHESCLLFASTSTYTTRSLLTDFASAEQCTLVCCITRVTILCCEIRAHFQHLCLLVIWSRTLRIERAFPGCFMSLPSHGANVRASPGGRGVPQELGWMVTVFEHLNTSMEYGETLLGCRAIS